MKIIVIGAHRTGSSKLCFIMSELFGVPMPEWPNRAGAEIFNTDSEEEKYARVVQFNESKHSLIKIMPHHWTDDLDKIDIDWSQIDLIVASTRASALDTYLSWYAMIHTRKTFGEEGVAPTQFTITDKFLTPEFIMAWYGERIAPVEKFIKFVEQKYARVIKRFEYDQICNLNVVGIPLLPTGYVYERDCLNYNDVKTIFVDLGLA